MNEINRKASAFWNGDLDSGAGLINTESMSLFEQPYSFQARFGNVRGTNPEELLAAAHAACFSMALADTLHKNGFDPKRTDTDATCTMISNDGDHEITRMQLHVRAEVPNIDEATFQKLIKEAEQDCSVSNLLRGGLDIEIEAALLETKKV
jgi:osmotically inducible protein OsmC